MGHALFSGFPGRAIRPHDAFSRNVEHPREAYCEGEADKEQNDNEAADPFGDVERLENTVDDLEQDKGDAAVDRRHPEHSAALELGEEDRESGLLGHLIGAVVEPNIRAT